MLQKYYEILGVSEYSSDQEITEAYGKLREKYAEERFLEGEKGNEAAKKLTQLENAYSEIMRVRKEQQSFTDNDSLYSAVDKALKANDISKAQELLDSFDERGAEWHYLQSVVFYKKKWMNDCKKQLEIAISLDDNNQKYKDAYNKLLEKMKASQTATNNNSNNQDWNKSGTGRNAQNANYNYNEPQMGGSSCVEFCCQMALCNMCLNCCCNCR